MGNKLSARAPSFYRGLWRPLELVASRKRVGSARWTRRMANMKLTAGRVTPLRLNVPTRVFYRLRRLIVSRSVQMSLRLVDGWSQVETRQG